MVLPLILALLSFVSGSFFLAGLFSGLAVIIKQTAAFNFLALVALTPFIPLSQGERGRGKARKMIWLVLGFLFFPALSILYFWSKGALTDFMNAIFFYSLGMVKPSLISFLVKTALLFVFESSVLWVLAIAGGIFIIRKIKDEKLWVLLIWSIFSLVGVYAVGYALGHYYVQVIPALCLLGGVALSNWNELIASRSSKILFALFLVALGLFIIANEYEFYTVYGPDRIALERYGTPINGIARQIGMKIRERTRPGDLVYGISSAVVYSGRSSLTKYYLTVRGGRTEVWFLGRLVYRHDFGIQRDPELVKKVDEDFYRNLSDPRTRYWAVNLKDNYAPADIEARIEQYGYAPDRELSDVKDAILVFKRL